MRWVKWISARLIMAAFGELYFWPFKCRVSLTNGSSGRAAHSVQRTSYQRTFDREFGCVVVAERTPPP